MNNRLDDNYSCDSKVLQQKPAARIAGGAAGRTAFVCELLKTFSTPMDIFSLNRTILNEIMKISGAAYSAISYFDDNRQLKYIQKSNGGFEKKKKRPRFYFELSSSETVTRSKSETKDFTSGIELEKSTVNSDNIEKEHFDAIYKFFQSDFDSAYDKVTFIPVTFGRHKIGMLEIYFSENSKTDKFISSADFHNVINIFSNCASVAIVNCIIRNENFNEAENTLSGDDKREPESKIQLTNETFLTYTELITALIAVTTGCEYSGAFLYDSGSGSFRIVGEKQIAAPLQAHSKTGVISDSAVAQNRLLASWLVEDAVYEKQVIDNKTACKKAGVHKTVNKNYLAAPMLNLKSGSGGIAIINKLPAEEKDFNYDETMALLLLTNYLGTFYDNFLHSSNLENKSKSLSIVYSIANISNNIFNSSAEFESAIRNTLIQIAFYMKAGVCGMIIHDSSAGVVNVYSSSERNVSGPLIALLEELDLKFWENSSAEQNLNLESGILNLSRVNIFKDRLDRFNAKIGEIFQQTREFEVLLKPVYHKKSFIGYMFILNSERFFDEDYYRINEESEKESEQFINAVSAMLTSVIISQRNYSEIMRLEKYAARMERLAALGEVAAGIAHEIRNPLGGISLFATSIESSFDADDKRKKWIGHIIDAVTRIGNMVSNLLNFSREEIINKRKYDLANLIKESGISISHELKDKNILLECAGSVNFGSPVFEVYCDTEKIKQVIINILTNAINAFEKNKNIEASGNTNDECAAKELTGFDNYAGQAAEAKKIIIAYEYDEANDQTVIWVANNGPKIPDELLEKIFRPFFTTRSRGTGLGLAISQKIVDAHGGSIKILNSKNQQEHTSLKNTGKVFVGHLKMPESVESNDTIFEIRLPNENKICYNKK